MNRFIIIIGYFFIILRLYAEEMVGVQMNNQGLVTKIIPFYKTPVLIDWKETEPADPIEKAEIKETKLNKYVVELKKPLSAFEKEMERLQSLPLMNIPMKSCPLHAAIRLCAEAANMSYIAPAKDDFNDSVTLKVYATPYEILTMFTEHYGLGMEYERGMWHFYKVNENELITRKYHLLYNNQAIIQIEKPELSKAKERGINNSNYGNVESLFVDTNVIVKEIQKILSLPTTGLEAVIEEGGSVNNFSKISTPSLESCAKGQQAPVGRVIYISDTNQLMVVATRQQHSYIQTYLESVDRPQRLIKIEAKFVETNLDPKTEMGIDWSNLSGAKLSLNSVKGDPMKSSWPPTALLSAKDMALQFYFIKTDSNSTIVQDPQVVTTNNRKVSLKSVIQQPIESANNNQNTLVGNNSTSTIDYLEIGTIINIFPQIMEGSIVDFNTETVQLNISIVVSSISGEKEIRGNPYPIVSSRTYDYSVIIPSGYTLAIGGLSECNQTVTQTRLPFLSDIPILGYVFKSKKDKQSKRNLIAYITPTILNSRSKEIERNCF